MRPRVRPGAYGRKEHPGQRMLAVSWTETRMLVGSERPAVSPSERRPSRPNARATLIPGALNASPTSPLAGSPLSLDGLGLPAPCGSGRGASPPLIARRWGASIRWARLPMAAPPSPQRSRMGREPLGGRRAERPSPSLTSLRHAGVMSAPVARLPLRHPAAHDDCARCLLKPARTDARPCRKS
jgi:hypothetical protein